MPTSTYISSLQSIKVVSIGGNANGDNKLKPLLLYSNKNQGDMKVVDISLPVIWKSLRKAWKMRHILRHCCEDYLLTAMKKMGRTEVISRIFFFFF